jgi:hypothetical protein
MRKKIFLIHLALVSFLLVGTSCDKQQKFEIYENRVIACCGISNPTENLEWLKTLMKDLESYSALSIKLYQDNANNTLKIVIEDNIFTRVYNCDGEFQFGGHYSGATNVPQGKSNIPSVSPVPCGQCEEFYNTHHFVGLIYEKKIVE